MQRKTALSLGYLNAIIIFLKPPGAWPSEAFGKKSNLFTRIHRITLPYHTSIIIFGNFYYLYENFHLLDIMTMGHMFLTTVLSLITALRAVLPNIEIFRSILRKYALEFHLMHHTHKGPKFEEMNRTVERISILYTKFSVTLLCFGPVMFNIGPAVNNLRNTVFHKTENYSMEYSVYFSYPGFKPLDYFASTTVYNFYLSYNCATLFFGLDSLMYLMIFQIIGHVFVLRHNLENIARPKSKVVLRLSTLKTEGSCTSELFDAEENEQIRVKLADSIEHHKQIMGFTDELTGVYGPVLALNYFFHMIACCLTLLECSKGGSDSLLRYGHLTLAIFGQLVQISVTFEFLGSVSEKLRDSIYFTPWESMNISNQRTVCIVLHKMQEKISVKALGLTSVGVSTMAGILKTTFSYYAFLKTMEQ